MRHAHPHGHQRAGDPARHPLRQPSRHALATAMLALTAASFGLALPLATQAQDVPPPAARPDHPGADPMGADHRGPHGGPWGGPGAGGHRGDRHGGPFIHALRELDLSDAQRQTIRGYLRSARDESEDARERLHAQRRSFELSAPDSSGYQAAVNQLANAEARLAADRVQREAVLKAKVYATLTDAQKAQLNQKLAAMPQQRPPL